MLKKVNVRVSRERWEVQTASSCESSRRRGWGKVKSVRSRGHGMTRADRPRVRAGRSNTTIGTPLDELGANHEPRQA